MVTRKCQIIKMESRYFGCFGSLWNESGDKDIKPNSSFFEYCRAVASVLLKYVKLHSIDYWTSQFVIGFNQDNTVNIDYFVNEEVEWEYVENLGILLDTLLESFFSITGNDAEERLMSISWINHQLHWGAMNYGHDQTVLEEYGGCYNLTYWLINEVSQEGVGNVFEL